MRVTQLVKVGEKSGMGDRILVKQVCGDYSPKSKHSMLHKQSYWIKTKKIIFTHKLIICTFPSKSEYINFYP